MAKLKTGRHTGAMKAHRQSVRREQRNRAIKRHIRALAKELKEAAIRKDAKAVEELTRKVSSAWDKAAQRGVIHWKAAARKKSRLAALAQASLPPKPAQPAT